MNYRLIKNVPDHMQLQAEVTLQLWPEFMLHDPVSNENWKRLYELFPEYQFSLIADGEILGTANTIPYHWDQPFSRLPEEGWDWVLQKGIADKQNGIQPNVLNGLQIAVDKGHQGKGLSTTILKEMISLAREHGFEHVTVPVRPSLKSKYPLIPIEDYLKWERDDGLPFDPWLRVHVRLGGRIIKACHKSMYIPGSIADWEKWTKMKFPASGDYVIDGALRPIKVQVEQDLGVYEEPNVWVVHEVR